MSKCLLLKFACCAKECVNNGGNFQCVPLFMAVDETDQVLKDLFLISTLWKDLKMSAYILFNVFFFFNKFFITNFNAFVKLLLFRQSTTVKKTIISSCAS